MGRSAPRWSLCEEVTLYDAVFTVTLLTKSRRGVGDPRNATHFARQQVEPRLRSTEANHPGIPPPRRNMSTYWVCRRS